MSRRDYIRASIAIAAAEHFTPIVRNAIISEADFRSEFQVTVDAMVNLGKEGVQFQRSVLFDGIKAAFGGNGEELSVADTGGGEWKVHILRDKEPTTVAIAQGEKRFLVTHLALLSPDKETRVKVFRHQADEVNLPEDSRQSWEALLQRRRPDHDEIGLIQDDLNDTPTITLNTIRDNLASGTISLDVLVRRSARYYERLVGRCADKAKIEDYIREVAVRLMRSNIGWRAFGGYQLALLLTSQPAFSLALGEIETEEGLLSKVFDWAATKGDAISRASCIEIGLRRISADPPIREPLSKLIDSFAKDTPVAHIDQFKLLSALFIAVCGEMSFRRVLSSKPPFWRRLAALAQAGMIARQIIAIGHNVTEVADWLMSVRAQTFALQCYADMRLEPRWFAELAMPKQLRNELIGRAWLAAKSNEEAVVSQGWADKLLGESDETLLSQFQIAQAFLPGPLEGGSNAAQEMPQELFDSIQSDLSETTITATSFRTLANAALVYRLSPQLANLAAAAIVRADYRLEIGEPKIPLETVLVAMATVAAVTRNHALADALFVVLRKYRKFYPDELSIHDTFRVAMTASASREELLDWTKCVGGCMNDVAFQKITPEEANHLHSHILCLCHLVPELWATCGQAEAALQAVATPMDWTSRSVISKTQRPDLSSGSL